MTNEKKPFLRYDNKSKTNRIVIWMSGFGIDWLRESIRIHGDGTFKQSSKWWYQFYVIFGEKSNKFIIILSYTLSIKQNI